MRRPVEMLACVLASISGLTRSATRAVRPAAAATAAMRSSSPGDSALGVPTSCAMAARATPSQARPCFPWEYGADTYVRMLSCARSVPFDSSSAQAMDQVIQRCLDGDQAAWETIVRTHWRRVFNIAYKFVGRHDQAEDLTKDVFLKLYK